MLHYFALYDKYHLNLYGPLSPTVPKILCLQLDQIKEKLTETWKCEELTLTEAEKVMTKETNIITKEELLEEVEFYKKYIQETLRKEITEPNFDISEITSKSELIVSQIAVLEKISTYYI